MNILKSTWFNILMLIFLPIIGLITMWAFSTWSTIVKVILTVVFAGAFMAWVAIVSAAIASI